MKRKPKISIILQARVSSTRLPRKVLANLGGKPMIIFQLNRIKKSKLVDEIIVATTSSKDDKELIDLLKNFNIKVVVGSNKNVLKRYKKCLDYTNCDVVIRLTGDCPLTDPNLIDELINEFIKKNVDYMSNCNPPSYPDGLDIEIFTREALEKSYKLATSNFDKEHVTPFIRESGLFKTDFIAYKKDLSHMRWTVDEPEDLIVIRNIVEALSNIENFSWLDVLELNYKKPNLFSANKLFKRNEGSQMSEGSKLWRRAKKVIPGGNMLLSKRSEMFLPGSWPSYYSKAKGCKVWTLEGKQLIDVSIMGIGTNILGYGNESVDNAVREVIERGNMSTFNCPEEVYLAEELIKIHSWAEMAKFARTGGEANSIAVRIARAFTGKEKIAICGYHGWHDWYLATNLQNKNGLDNHLLSGLKADGVPSGLEGTVIPFNYNDLESIKNIVEINNLAAIKMEVERNIPPNKGFLEAIRNLCDEKNIILIFDECTSGFREVFGGHHLKYEVNPDMAIFGKALGNGYAITAILGKKEIMEKAQDTFISSTFWTERIGPTAAIATLKEMKDCNSWDKITFLGNYMKSGWERIFKENSMRVEFQGISALCGFTLDSEINSLVKTLISQEMLKKGYIASNLFYASTAHSVQIIEDYLEHLEKLMQKISKMNLKELKDSIEGEICHTGFQRLN